MVTDAQQQANEQNAQLGGVKTEEGKAVSKYNAQKHAILRQTITEYEQEFYEQVLDNLFEEKKPEGVIEELLVEIIATGYVKLYRAAKAEGEFFKATFNPLKKIGSKYEVSSLPDPDAKWVGYAPKLSPDSVERITNIYTRYQITIENRLYRALHELERLQRMRKGERITAPLTVDVDVSKMGSFGENPIQE